MGWNYLSIPKLQRCTRWSLGMDKRISSHTLLACDYLSMLGLKLNHVSNRGCFKHNDSQDVRRDINGNTRPHWVNVPILIIYRACIWISFHQTRPGGTMASYVLFHNSQWHGFSPKVSWDINGLENVLVTPEHFFTMVLETLLEYIATQKLSFPVAIHINKFFSQPLHCPSQWAANCHKTLFRIIGHDS